MNEAVFLDKNESGIKLFAPMNDVAKMLCDLIGRRLLGTGDIERVKAIGFVCFAYNCEWEKEKI
jgi:hypothetical protein